MKKILVLLLVIIGFTGCKKDEPIQTPINPLANTNWRGSTLYEFTNDSLIEYNGYTDLLYYSGYIVKADTIRVVGSYINDWGKKSKYDTSYSVQFLIRNDSLFFNGIYKGKKY